MSNVLLLAPEPKIGDAPILVGIKLITSIYDSCQPVICKNRNALFFLAEYS